MQDVKGIGEEGKTLKRMIQEGDRLYGETGCYHGITDPSLLHDDPVKLELFHSRMMAALISGRETTRMISGSPFVREVAELCIGLFTPEGDNITQSTGIQVHIRCMGENIKWMINNDWESEVGIDDGDMFICNESVMGSMHPADVYDIMPIFWEGELVAWVGTVIMEVDIGAVSPGCMPTANVERSTDGLRWCGEKIGIADKLRRDFEVKIELSMDMPDMFLLDRKGAIAANIRVREEIKSLIREFGLGYFKRAGRELIEEERRNQIARIKQRTVPGRYRDFVPLEYYMSEQPVTWVPARKDSIRLVPLEMVITADGGILLDFEGAGEWGWHPFNAYPAAIWGGLSIATVQTLSYDGRANLGSLLPFEIKAPVDSVLNPSELRRLATSTVWSPLLDIFGLWFGKLGEAYFLRGFREEIFNMRSSAGWQMYGYDQYGMKRPLMLSPLGNFGPGATGVCDGVDNAGWIATPETDMGNVEIWEMFVPYLDFTRRFEPSSCGFGMFRSGLAISGCYMMHGSRQAIASGAIGCAHDRIIPNLGMFGGYPGGKRNTILVRYRDLQGVMQQRKPLIHRIGDPSQFGKDIEGEVTVVNYMLPPIEVKDGDMLVTDNCSAGGLGDPIDRDPSWVKADLDQGFTTEEIASRMYCVSVSYDENAKEWKVDEAETESLRQARRKQRLSRAVPVKDWWEENRERIISRDMHPLLLEMYESSMKMSQSFAEEYRDFWSLPDDFAL